MINFIKYFSQFNGTFEFILNNNKGLNKILFCFKENKSDLIFDYIKKNIKLNNQVQNIFKLYFKNIHHIGYDKENNRYKFYIQLYKLSFKDSLQIIKTCKDILNIKEKYFLEKSFYNFDSIGFDVTEELVNMKIYELINKKDNYDGLIDDIKKEDIKEIGYLKDFYGRRKKFFRLNNYQNIKRFNNYFNIDVINNFEFKIKDYYLLQKKVKYFCIEGNKKEIYFI